MYVYHCLSLYFFFFFFNDTATTEIYTLSLHDALPISAAAHRRPHRARPTQTQNPHTPDLALGKPTRYLPPHHARPTPTTPTLINTTRPRPQEQPPDRGTRRSPNATVGPAP